MRAFQHNSSEDVDILIRPTQFPLVLRLMPVFPMSSLPPGTHYMRLACLLGLRPRNHLDSRLNLLERSCVSRRCAVLVDLAPPDLDTMRVPDRVDGVLNEVLNTYFCSGNVKTHYRQERRVYCRRTRTLDRRISHSIGNVSRPNL